MPEKAYFFDTSLCIQAPNFIKIWSDNRLGIPFPVLEELDHRKEDPNGVGKAARDVIEQLDYYQMKGSLTKGVRTDFGGTLVVDYRGDLRDLPMRLEDTNDNRIIAIAWRFMMEEKKKGDLARPVILLSQDRNMRVKANACGLTAQGYDGGKKISSIDQLYSGHVTIKLPEDRNDILTQLHRAHSKKQLLPESVIWDLVGEKPLCPNACCRFEVPESGSRPNIALAVYKKAKRGFRLVPWKKGDNDSRGIFPMNAEQAFVYDLAMDQDVECLAIVGPAGTGKTIMELAAGLHQLETDQIYERIAVYRANIEVGNRLGFLPGNLTKKFVEPYGRAITDVLRLILESKGKPPEDSKRFDVYRQILERIERMFREERLEISPINFARGLTLNGQFIIIDDAQNLLPGNMKMLITRAGIGTKVVINGDPDPAQIDEPTLDPLSNGLVSTIQDLLGNEIFATVTMYDIVRSRLAKLAAERMR